MTGLGLLAGCAAGEGGHPGDRALVLLPGLLRYGLGGGIVATSLLGLALAEVVPEDAGAASGGLLTAVQVAEAAGVAGIGALFAALSAAHGSGGAFGACVALLAGLWLPTTALLSALRRPAGTGPGRSAWPRA